MGATRCDFEERKVFSGDAAQAAKNAKVFLHVSDEDAIELFLIGIGIERVDGLLNKRAPPATDNHYVCHFFFTSFGFSISSCLVDRRLLINELKKTPALGAARMALNTVSGAG
jgi:hypothetical protein